LHNSSAFLLEFGDFSLQHSNASEQALNFISRFFCPGVLDDQILAIPFQSSRMDKPWNMRFIILKTSSLPLHLCA